MTVPLKLQTLLHCGVAFFGSISIKAHSSQRATIGVYIGRCNACIWKARKSQSISGSAVIHAMSSSSETTCSIYLKRAALHGNKWAGVWRWHTSFLCLDTKANFKWWNWQRTCSCLVSDYTPLQTDGTAEWSWCYSSGSKLNQNETGCAACVLLSQKHICYCRHISRIKIWQKGEKKQIQRDYNLKDNEFAPFSVFQH